MAYRQEEIAALLEANYENIDSQARRGRGLPLDDFGLKGFTVLECGEFERDEYKAKYPDDWKSPKALVVRDAEGNIYVHFRGTADGNWPYNAVAYGPQNGKTTSEVQDWALKYFDQTVAKYYEGQAKGKLFVSGHSQGANNAQFVTIRSQYGDYIERCTSLDGPGFSTQSIEEAKAKYGEAYFERQRDKIYAYNGEFDYVSCLGQEQIVPENHIQYIAYDFEHNGFSVELFHASEGLFIKDKDGNIIRLGELQNGYSDFRRLVLALNKQITELPADQQQDAARLVMKLCENVLGGGEIITVDFSDEEKERLKQLLVPVLVEGIEENPELIKSILLEMGLDSAFVNSIDTLISEFNELPSGVRREAIEAIVEFGIDAALTPGLVGENGEVNIDWSKFDYLPVLAAGIPIIIETALHHPADLATVIHELGLDEALANGIKEHPGITIAAIAGIIIFLPQIMEVLTAIVIVDVLIHIAEGLAYLGNKAADFILHMLNAAKEAYQKVKEWFRNNFNAGVKYAQQNPYINVDTQSLRTYAQRISNVNRRLRNLDGDLRDLYWQVGFLDLWDILMANLLTGQSYALSRVEGYLNSAADSFDIADGKAKRYIGG